MFTSEEWKEAKAILGRALEIRSTSEQFRFVQLATAGDSALTERIMNLLRADSGKFDFLDSGVALEEASWSSDCPFNRLPSEPTLPAFVGPFLPLQMISANANGTTYLCTSANEQRMLNRDASPGLELSRWLEPPHRKGWPREMVLKLSAESDASQSAIRNEFAVLSHIRSRAVPHPYGLGLLTNERLALVLDYLPGSSFLQRSCIDGRSPNQSLRTFEKACRVVHSLHLQGVIHLDLKPEHIIVDEARARVSIIDFGSAEFLGRLLSRRRSLPSFTPEYASPEQISLSCKDCRSDIYSLGVILSQLYESLVARSGEANSRFSGKLLGSSSTTLTADGRSAIVNLIRWCTSPDPGRRPQSARNLADLVHALSPGGSCDPSLWR